MKEYNIVLAGVGGQGILTIIKILDDAAMLQGYDVKSSELHGLAQRYGSITGHVRFGKKMHSSVIMEGEAHIVIGLEPLEALRSAYFGSKENKTMFVVNDQKIVPPAVGKNYPKMETMMKDMKGFSKNVIILNGTSTVKEVTGNDMSLNIYMLGYASKFIPIKKQNLLKAIKMNIKPKYFEMNKKIFELGANV